MTINIILPTPPPNTDAEGYSEMLACEIASICKQVNSKTIIKVTHCTPFTDSDVYIFVMQYREDVFSEWWIQSMGHCKKSSIKLACGRAASVERDYILEKKFFNAVILGQVEGVLDSILITLIKTGVVNFTQMPGLSIPTENQCSDNSLYPACENLDQTPMPLYEYMFTEDYSIPFAVIETSRGCHGKCKFCEGHLYRQLNPGQSYRVKSPERIIKEVQDIIDTFNRRIFVFSDDNFFVDGSPDAKRRVLEFAKMIIDKKIKIRFTFECRADDINEEIFKILKQAGLYKVFIGIESGSQNVLNRYNKGTTIEDNIKAITTLHKLNILCEAGYIFFDPQTTVKELEETISFFKEYSSMLYSPDNGSTENLFFPSGCKLLQDYWPNKNDLFYKSISRSGDSYKFSDFYVNKIHKIYTELLQKQSHSSGKNILEMRIHCLEKAVQLIKQQI